MPNAIETVFAFQIDNSNIRIGAKIWEHSPDHHVVIFEILPCGNRPNENPGPAPQGELIDLLTQFVNAYGLNPHNCTFLIADQGVTDVIKTWGWENKRALRQILKKVQAETLPPDQWEVANTSLHPIGLKPDNEIVINDEIDWGQWVFDDAKKTV